MVWKDAERKTVDTSKAGTYTVSGTVTNKIPVQCTITVSYPNLLKNPSFEDDNMSMYAISSIAARAGENPYSGEKALKFWSADDMSFTAEQTILLQPGSYVFTLHAQGGDMGENPNTYAYVKYGDTTLTDDFSLTGWLAWDDPTISFTLTQETNVTVGVSVTAAGGAWGTFDDWYLYTPTSSKPSDVTSPQSFSDVPAGRWYASAIAYVTENKLMTGITVDTFSPEAQVTWSMLRDNSSASGLVISGETAGTAIVTREAMVEVLYYSAFIIGWTRQRGTELHASKAAVGNHDSYRTFSP